MQFHDNPTKLEFFLRSHQTRSCCETPVIHIAQQVFLKCPKCGASLTKGFTLSQVLTVQDDLICP